MKLHLEQKCSCNNWRRTKIIATLGPATRSEAKIAQLIEAGVNIFRLNMSHGTHEEHELLAEKVRKVAKRKKIHIGILMDLCGPKIRVGKFKEDKIELRPGEKVVVSCSAKLGDVGLIVSQYKRLYNDVAPSDRILLDDGKLELEVQQIDGKDVICEVVYGGILKNNKGLNLPDSKISTSSFTSKDKKDTELAVKIRTDFLALSFVRDEKCIKTLKRYLTKLDSKIPVIAKIEKPEAIEHIENILHYSDGIMVARGDLGIEVPPQQVPLLQKQLINRARFHAKPVIVATQMLESMIVSSKPTRAEVGDVATAALSSADAVMLSAETASGDFPVESVAMMDDILREMESYQLDMGKFGELEFDKCAKEIEAERKAIARAVKTLSNELNLQGIIVPTRSGTTARILSADRPGSPLVGISSDASVCRRLNLSWGIIPISIDEEVIHDWKDLCDEVSDLCGLGASGNRILLISGFSNKIEENEPVMKLMHITGKEFS